MGITDRFLILNTTMEIALFWYMKPCSLVEISTVLEEPTRSNIPEYSNFDINITPYI